MNMESNITTILLLLCLSCCGPKISPSPSASWICPPRWLSGHSGGSGFFFLFLSIICLAHIAEVRVRFGWAIPFGLWWNPCRSRIFFQGPTLRIQGWMLYCRCRNGSVADLQARQVWFWLICWHWRGIWLHHRQEQNQQRSCIPR